MKQKNIIIPKTARYFILGEASDAIEQIWFVCHGYGQLANYFLKNFESLNDGKNLIIAPEGLHRFYWEKFSGRVVASWMTKEDREEDVKDYVNYLKAVYSEVMVEFCEKKVQINVLGFSQGVATVCRWLADGVSRADRLVLWAGGFPSDSDMEQWRKRSEHLKIKMIVGDQDEFISEKEITDQEIFLKKNKIAFELIRFHGKHELNTETLLRIASNKS